MDLKYKENLTLIETVKERCRVCYTCVRECPAKAIRIREGQAEVIPTRCIGCGNCVRVCSQNAKKIIPSAEIVQSLLDSNKKVAAIVAPSFAAEFHEMQYRKTVGMIRAMGFDLVNEVAFGADLVASEYRRLLKHNYGSRYIATSCPAIVAYVERYHPDLVDSLAPIVSPMVATARALRILNDSDLKMVFIGPCIAKKGEAFSEQLPDEIDAVLTFKELREMLEEKAIKSEEVEESDFDPPYPNTGTVFCISRGLLQVADIEEDIMTGEVMVADGRMDFVEAIKEFQSGAMDARLLEVLCCKGCIMGAGMTNEEPLFRRSTRIRQYAREQQANSERMKKQPDLFLLNGLDLTRSYVKNDQRIPVPTKEELNDIMIALGKFNPQDELNCGACGYDTCMEHAIAIYKGLAEHEMCLPYTIDRLKKTIGELAESHEELASTQEALIQSEKLASMGQLAAGIAHEVNNPLGVVLMFAHMLKDNQKVSGDFKEDLEMIVQQADRCKKIVSGLLHFARQNKVLKERVDICKLIEGVLKTVPCDDGISVQVQHEIEDPIAEIDRDQIVQVLTNLVSNAIAAMENHGVLTIRTFGDEGEVHMSVQDTGMGIPPDNLSKIFEPFFTTKQLGKGTGLGLAVAYGIIKMHSGDIQVQSNVDPTTGPRGTIFTVSLPRKGDKSQW